MMLKLRLFILSLCFTGSCIIVAMLYFVSIKRLNDPNGFLRKLPSHKIVGTGFINLKYNSYYIAGGDTSGLYIGNWLIGNRLIKVQFDTKRPMIEAITGFDTVKLHQGSYYRTDSENVYLLDGVKPTVLSGSVGDHKLVDRLATPYFTEAIPLHGQSFIFRISTNKRHEALLKFDGHHKVVQYSIDQPGDNVFSSDGALIKCANASKLFYINFYRNQFLCLDTNLRLVYKGKTIDTVSHSTIKIGQINSSHQITLASPPKFVNEQAAVNDHYLFIHSALKADNEIDVEMREANPIDIYRVADGKYQFSFYLPNVNKEKLRDFKVYGSMLVALYDHYLYFYQLKF